MLFRKRFVICLGFFGKCFGGKELVDRKLLSLRKNGSCFVILVGLLWWYLKWKICWFVKV